MARKKGKLTKAILFTLLGVFFFASMQAQINSDQRLALDELKPYYIRVCQNKLTNSKRALGSKHLILVDSADKKKAAVVSMMWAYDDKGKLQPNGIFVTSYIDSENSKTECIEDASMEIYFTDGTKLFTANIKEPNCQGAAWMYLSYEDMAKQLSDKALDHIVFYNLETKNIYTLYLESKDRHFFMEATEAYFNKRIQKVNCSEL